jgi:hypothetical protein
MDRTKFRAVISLAALLAASSSGRAEEDSRWPRSAEELEVSLSVVHALEDGPFVCKVHLKNVSKRTLNYTVGENWHEAQCLVAADWKAKKEPLITGGMYMGPAPPFSLRLAPGESASPTFYLHRSFLGVPAGDVRIRFGWDVYRTVKNTSKEDKWRSEDLKLLFSLKRTKTVKVLPATKENVVRVLRVLEADFARIAQDAESQNDYIWMSPSCCRCRDGSFST